jgi:hypothetical protein
MTIDWTSVASIKLGINWWTPGNNWGVYQVDNPYYDSTRPASAVNTSQTNVNSMLEFSDTEKNKLRQRFNCCTQAL